MPAREPAPASPHPPPLQRLVGMAFVIAGLASIAFIGLTPTGDPTPFPILCLTCGDRPAVDALLNVLLFVPLGAGLGLLGLGVRQTLVVGIGATLTVEVLQYAVIAGRYPAARDVVANSVGALAGYGMGRAWRQLAFPSQRSARVAFAVLATIWMGTQALTAWAMAFAPPPPTWYGQMAPRHDRFARVFTGRIVALSVGTLPIIENDTLVGVADLRRQLRAGAPLSATVAGVQSSPGIAPIIIVASLPGDVISWAVDGNDAVFAAAVRGHFIGLRQPSVRLADVVPSSAADTLTLTGAYSGGRYRLRAESPGTVRTRTLAASASFGWAFAVPLPRYAFGAEVHALTALWLAVIWAMLGFWARRGSGRARPNRVILGLSIIVLMMGLGIIPRLLGIPASHWTEWLASAGSFLIAWTGSALPRMG